MRLRNAFFSRFSTPTALRNLQLSVLRLASLQIDCLLASCFPAFMQPLNDFPILPLLTSTYKVSEHMINATGRPTRIGQPLIWKLGLLRLIGMGSQASACAIQGSASLHDY